MIKNKIAILLSLLIVILAVLLILFFYAYAPRGDIYFPLEKTEGPSLLLSASLIRKNSGDIEINWLVNDLCRDNQIIYKLDNEEVGGYAAVCGNNLSKHYCEATISYEHIINVSHIEYQLINRGCDSNDDFISDAYRISYCGRNSDEILQIVGYLEDFYSKNSRFPNFSEVQGEQVLTGEYMNKNDIDALSASSDDEFFIYFKDGCKLQIKPDSYEIYE